VSRHRVAAGMRKSSKSTGQKILRAFARGWFPGAGPIADFLGKRRKKSFSNETTNIGGNL